MPKWLTYSVASILLYGVWGVVPKWIPNTSPEIVFILSTIGIVPVALSFLFSKNLKQGKSIPKGLAWAVATGLCGGLASLALYAALKRGEASRIFPFMSPYPLIAVIGGMIFLKERPNAIQGIGVILALAAMYLLSY